MSIKSIFPEVKPSLNLDFANTKQLDPRITFTRATSGTYFDSKGVMQTAAAGVARFDHDPLTGESFGLLIEESRYNAFLNSDVPVTQSITVTAIPYTLSFYGTGTINLSGVSTASLVGTGAFPTRTILTFTPSAGSLTLTLSGTVEKVQLEPGSFATSYIPTGASQVTRAADSASMVGSNFSSWYRQDEGAIFAEVKANATPAGSMATFGSGTENYIQFGQFAASITYLLYVEYGNAVVASLTEPSATYPAGVAHKFAATYKTNDFSASGNGRSVLLDASGSIPSVSALQIGNFNGNTNYLNGTIKRITYYPKRLTNAQLQSLTA